MLTDWILRLRSLFRRSGVEEDLDDELQFHLEQQALAHVREGLSQEEAVRRARLQLGGVVQIKEEHRDARGIAFVEDIGRDAWYALRQLKRAPGFALVAVLCLGLGIGVNTAIFGVLNAVLLRSMPVDEPEQLIGFSQGQATSFSYPAYRDFQMRSRTLSALTASFPMESDLDVNGESEFVAAEVVSANYGAVLGVRPSLGRWFVDDAEPTAVISHAVWQRRFNLNPDVLGRRIQSESQAYTIAGVAPPEFIGVFAPMRTDLWVPVRTRPSLAALFENRRRTTVMLFGRLSPGATAAQVSAELAAINAQVAAEQGDAAETRSPIVAGHIRGLPNAGIRRLVGTGASLLAVVVALVLLIACVNVGNLVLARGAQRQREFAVRRALGATRSRLLRQLLAESLVLAIAGGICGVMLALWTNSLLERSLASLPTVFPRQLDLSLDWHAIAFATAVSLATTVLCGFLPAWRTSRTGALVTRRRRPLGLVAQVVMSLVLLFVAGSFLDALRQLQTTDPGFAVAGRVYAYAFTPAPAFTPATGREFYARAVQQLRTLPGIRSAALTDSLPLMPGGSDCVGLPSGPQIRVTTSAVDLGFFETMSIPIIAGRNFEAGDLSRGASTVMVTESLARRLWPDRPPVGQAMMIGCDATQAAVVVGVTRDSAIRALGELAQPHLYRPFDRQFSNRLTAILLETTEPARMAQAVRDALLEMGQGIRVYTVQPLSTYVEQSYAEMRWEVAILAIFGVLALLLAAMGLYGVIAYRVSLRTQEIGVRIALGASRAAIFREVLWHGLTIVLVGVAIGEVLTLPLTLVAGSLQVGIRPADLSTHATIALIWIAVALVACYVPAARAARVDPLVALRYE